MIIPQKLPARVTRDGHDEGRPQALADGKPSSQTNAATKTPEIEIHA